MNVTVVNNKPSVKTNDIYIKEKQIIDVELHDVESSCQTILCLVDNDNIDSLAGAALWISRLDLDKSVSVQNYSLVRDQELRNSYDQVVIFGCYIPEKILKNYKGTKHTKIFSYRNTYMGLKQSEDFEIVYPCDDWYGAEQAMVDNSIVFVVNQYMFSKDRPSGLSGLRNVVRDIALHTNYGHKGVDSYKMQISIHNVRMALERAFSKSKVVEAVRELQIRPDEDGYKQRVKQVRGILEHNGLEEIYRVPAKTWRVSPTLHKIKTFPCPSFYSRELISMALPVKGSCITYETIRDYKVFRIVTQDKRLSQFFAEQMKPLATWEEGETVVCLVKEYKKS